MDRRDFLKGALASTVIAVAATGPSMAAENVTAKTRALVESLRGEYAGAKLSQESEECLVGKLIDPECDSLINDEVRIYRKKQQVEAKEQQVAAKEQQVAIALEATEHIGITIALIQLAMYVDYNKTPSTQANQMEKIMEYKATSPEVKNLFSEFLGRKKRNDTFSWEKDGKRLMKLAENHLDKSFALQKELSDTRLSKTISEMTQSAEIGYKQTFAQISKKKA